MTEKNRRKSPPHATSPFNQRCLNVEMKKSSDGGVIVISPIMQILDFSHEQIILISHSGRIELVGQALELSVMQNRVVEVYGRITEVKFSYGKT